MPRSRPCEWVEPRHFAMHFNAPLVLSLSTDLEDEAAYPSVSHNRSCAGCPRHTTTPRCGRNQRQVATVSRHERSCARFFQSPDTWMIIKQNVDNGQDQ